MEIELKYLVEDEFTREYRKQYMRLQMKYKRHHYDSKYKDALIGMVSGGKEIREKVKENKISEKEWKEWLFACRIWELWK